MSTPRSGNLYRPTGEEERQRLSRNLAGALRGAPEEVIEYRLGHLGRANADDSRRVRWLLAAPAEPAAKKVRDEAAG